MRKHLLVQMLSTLDASSDRMFNTWMLEQALQVREPLFFGALPEKSILSCPDFVSWDNLEYASRTALSRGKQGFELHVYPHSGRFGPRDHPGVVTHRFVIEEPVFRDLLQIAELRRPGERGYA
jgi:hypothetical protein